MEITWRPPEHPNGIITGYELYRDGEVIYVGTETHYHDFTLSPSVDYSYLVRSNNSKGAVSSTAASAKTHPSAPSGVGLPTLTPLGPSQVGQRDHAEVYHCSVFYYYFYFYLKVLRFVFQVRVEWSSPVRPNGDIVSYTVYQRDPVQLDVTSTVFTPEASAFSERLTTLQGLAPYHRSVTPVD